MKVKKPVHNLILLHSMKLLILLALSSQGIAQPLTINGTIRCINKNTNSTRGLENVLIRSDVSKISTPTQTNPAGYFQLQLPEVQFRDLKNQTIEVKVYSRCGECKESVYHPFVDKPTITIDRWRLPANCTEYELTPKSLDSIKDIAANYEPRNYKKNIASSSALASPALLNVFTGLVKVVGVISNIGGQFPATTLFPGKITYGEFLLGSHLYKSANTGFNFAPERDFSDVMFSNLAAAVQSTKENNITVMTNFRNYGKFGGFAKISPTVTIGGGFIFATQDEFRTVDFSRPSAPGLVDSFPMKLNEYSISVGPSIAVTKKLSLGVNLKLIHQNMNIPETLYVDVTKPVPSYTTDSTIRRNIVDLDLSAYYQVSESLVMGINLMNLAGTNLYADAFVPGADTINEIKQRAVGIGATYKIKRVNIGADLVFGDGGLYDVSLGVNVVPFNHALISAGYTFKQHGYSISFRLRHFRIAYINDNDFMVSEKKKPDINIGNGKLFGGFVFDF
jgi:hypothetical protein